MDDDITQPEMPLIAPAATVDRLLDTASHLAKMQAWCLSLAVEIRRGRVHDWARERDARSADLHRRYVLLGDFCGPLP